MAFIQVRNIMKLHFLIVSKGRKNLRFDEGSILDQFIKNKKSFPPDAKIIFKNDDKIVGEMLVSRYIELSKNEANKENT